VKVLDIAPFAPISYIIPLVVFGLIFLGVICIVVAVIIIVHRRNH
jgi:hypothetical protein